MDHRHIKKSINSISALCGVTANEWITAMIDWPLDSICPDCIAWLLHNKSTSRIAELEAENAQLMDTTRQLEAQNAFLRVVLKQVRSFLDKSPYVLSSGAVVKQVRKIDDALKGSE